MELGLGGVGVPPPKAHTAAAWGQGSLGGGEGAASTPPCPPSRAGEKGEALHLSAPPQRQAHSSAATKPPRAAPGVARLVPAGGAGDAVAPSLHVAAAGPGWRRRGGHARGAGPETGARGARADGPQHAAQPQRRDAGTDLGSGRGDGLRDAGRRARRPARSRGSPAQWERTPRLRGKSCGARSEVWPWALGRRRPGRPGASGV